MNESNPTLAKRIADLERQLSNTKSLANSLLEENKQLIKQNAALAAQNIELAATVEALRNSIANYIEGKDKPFDLMKAFQATPQQHLRSVLHERDILSAQLASLSKHDSPLQHDLVIECERAMKQRDEWLKTGVSTAGNGGGWDTCFTFIVAKHTKANPEHLAEIRAQAGRAGFIAGSEQTANFILGEIGYVVPLLEARANQYHASILAGKE